MSENKKIGIVGYFGFDNAGDEAMKDMLLERIPNSVANYRADMEVCDAYIMAGGDLIQGINGLHMIKIWSKIKNEPCYALSLGVKPGWEKFQEEVVGYLKKFHLIYMRDSESYEMIKDYIPVNGVMPDLVLLADANPTEEKHKILFNYTDRPWVNPDGQFDDVVKQGNIEPVSLCNLDLDTKYAKKVVKWKEFISMAKSSQGVIGTRLHAVVMGVIAGVPVAGIAYEDKVRKFCQRYDVPYFKYGKKMVNQLFVL